MTGKQKRFLRAKANRIKANFQIGKEGITQNQMDALLDYLEKHELMKVSVLQNCPYEIDDLLGLFMEFEITVVQTVGRVIVLYKESKENKTIILP